MLNWWAVQGRYLLPRNGRKRKQKMLTENHWLNQMCKSILESSFQKCFHTALRLLFQCSELEYCKYQQDRKMWFWSQNKKKPHFSQISQKRKRNQAKTDLMRSRGANESRWTNVVTPWDFKAKSLLVKEKAQ